MEAMREFPDKYFDLAVVDPPYGIGEDGSKSDSRRRPTKKWANPKAANYKAYVGNDKEPPMPEFFNELRRVSKNQIIWGANHFIDRMPYGSPAWVVWDKKYETDGSDFADCELAWTSFKTAVRKFKMPWIGFAHINNGERRLRPNQKPVALYKWLLTNYAKPGDKILDTHLGSGSSRIAAWDMGFDFWGYELDADYFAAMDARFQAHISKPVLFAPEQMYRFEQAELFKD